MQKLKNTKTLFDINFPVYGITLSYRRIWEEYNVLYIETTYGTYILDNKNLPGDTVGKRRLRITKEDIYNPRGTCRNIEQILHSKYKTFLDTNGNIFHYKKRTFVPLKYYKVKSVEKISNSCVIILKGSNYTIRTNCRNAYSINFVGLLHTKLGYILYEFSDTRKKDTRRKI